MKKIIVLISIFLVSHNCFSQVQFFMLVKDAGTSYDSDAQAYFTALAGDVTVSDAQKGYINTFFLAAKANGWWATSQAIYLPIWSNASANKWNLKDPRDLDAAYRLTFYNATHGSTGVHGNGSNKWADTHFDLSTNLADINSFHFSYYSQTDVDGNISDGGVIPANIYGIRPRNSNTAYFDNSNNQQITVSNSTSIGMFEMSRTSSTLTTGYINGSSIGTNTGTNTDSAPALSWYLGDVHTTGGAGVIPSTRTCFFITLGTGENSTIAAAKYSDINTLKTALGL